MPHIMGQMYRELDHDFDTANQYLAVSACVNASLYKRVMSMKALSDCCFENGQYLIAKKLLKAIYILCNGYFLPSFVEKEYAEKLKKCEEKIEMIACGRCGKY